MVRSTSVSAQLIGEMCAVAVSGSAQKCLVTRSCHKQVVVRCVGWQQATVLNMCFKVQSFKDRVGIEQVNVLQGYNCLECKTRMVFVVGGHAC